MAPALLGLLLVGTAEVVSARLNLSHGTIDVRRVCNFLGSVLSQQKFEATDVKALSVSQLLDTLCLSSRTGQYCNSVLQLSFIQTIKENTSLRHEGMPTQKT